MEFFDVVDEFDCVVSQRPRHEVHRRGLRHRAVHVFLFATNGRMLIHRRNESKEEFPSVWTSSASGHVSAGETYNTAMQRELKEELGIEAPLHRLRKFEASPDTSMEFTVLYRAVSDDRIVVDRAEIADTQWSTVREIAVRLETQSEQFSPAFRLLFKWYAECSGMFPQG